MHALVAVDWHIVWQRVFHPGNVFARALSDLHLFFLHSVAIQHEHLVDAVHVQERILRNKQGFDNEARGNRRFNKETGLEKSLTIVDQRFHFKRACLLID